MSASVMPAVAFGALGGLGRAPLGMRQQGPYEDAAVGPTSPPSLMAAKRASILPEAPPHGEVIPGDVCETLTMITLRRLESIFSEVLTELPAGIQLEVLEVSAIGPRRRARVAAGAQVGWISMQTSFNEPLIRPTSGGSESSRRPSKLAAAEADEAEALRSLLSQGTQRAVELPTAARRPSTPGVEAEVARVVPPSPAEELGARLRAALQEGGDLAVARAAVAEAISQGVPAEQVQAAQAWIQAEERKARALCDLQAVVAEVAGVDLHSGLFAIREAKGRLLLGMQAAREAGCKEAVLKPVDLRRRQLHNAEEDLKGAIRVFCRVRPLSKKEREQGDVVIATAADATTLVVEHGRHKEPFSFDAVFVPGTQEEVFEDCRQLVQSALDGYNVTLFAYGQTGAGKTHTMYGTPADGEGTAPRTIREIYKLIDESRETHDHVVKASMMELYRNELVDLLADRPPSPGRRRPTAAAPGSSSSGGGGGGSTGSTAPPCGRDVDAASRLAVKVDSKTGEVQVDNLIEATCADTEDLLRLLDRGLAQRTVASTAMNSVSSRSHLLLIVRIARVNKATGEISHGKVAMCDLAGCERLKRSEATGDAQKEAIEINKSLTAIGDVIEALTTGQRHVPYKNHKLTQVLQDALGGTSKTLMFVNCSPASSNLEETINALKYATRVKRAVTCKAAPKRTPRAPTA